MRNDNSLQKKTEWSLNFFLKFFTQFPNMPYQLDMIHKSFIFLLPGFVALTINLNFPLRERCSLYHMKQLITKLVMLVPKLVN